MAEPTLWFDKKRTRFFLLPPGTLLPEGELRTMALVNTGDALFSTRRYEQAREAWRDAGVDRDAARVTALRQRTRQLVEEGPETWLASLPDLYRVKDRPDRAGAEALFLLAQIASTFDDLEAAVEHLTALAGEHVAALMEQTVRWPDGSDHSWASVLIGPWQEFVKDRTVLPTALDRVCTDDSALLLTLRRTLAEAGLPDIYGFLAGSGAHWCPAAVEPGGRVGFMRMGESAARGALGLEVALEDHVERLERIDALARRQGTVAKRLHARCGPELAALDTEGDPRLDPEGAIRAGVGWLAELHRGFAGRGWSDLDTVGLTLLAYDIGPLEVEAWIQAAVHEYGVGDEAAIGFIEILGGGVHVMSGASGSDGRGRHGDAIRLPTEVLGAALAMPPMLDETCWSDLERVGE